MTNGDTLSGKWSVGKVRLKAAWGEAAIEAKQIRVLGKSVVAPSGNVSPWAPPPEVQPLTPPTCQPLSPPTYQPLPPPTYQPPGPSAELAPMPAPTSGYNGAGPPPGVPATVPPPPSAAPAASSPPPPAPFSPEGIKQWLNKCLGAARTQRGMETAIMALQPTSNCESPACLRRAC